MRCLLVVVLASACGSTVALQAGPGVAYPRGLHITENPSRCRVSAVDRTPDGANSCDNLYRR